MVFNDLNKTFLRELEARNFDIILMDFIDERFDLYEISDGSIITLSVEFFKSEYKINKENVIEHGSEAWFQIWKNSWDLFIEKLNNEKIIDRIYINKVFLSYKTYSGLDYQPSYTNERINKINNTLEKIYEIALNDISENNFINYNPEVLLGADSHRWGVSPFHYIDQLYLSTIDRMNDISRTLSIEVPFKGANKSYENWNCEVFNHANSNDIISSDGIHAFEIDGQTIDIYSIGLSRLIEDNTIKKYCLVFLSGAVSDRKNKSGPFFSGLGIAKKMGLPLISLADPSLELDVNLNLAWYAGNRYQPKLQSQVLQIIENCISHYKFIPIFVGGSGGGFAAIQLAKQLSTASRVLAWNPQTDLTKYSEIYVNNYLNIAFESESYQNCSTLSPEEYLGSIGVDYHLNNYVKNPDVKIIYLQNKSDWHLIKHAKPFLEQYPLPVRINCNAFKFSFINFVVGNWGEGHFAPPVEEIVHAINEIIKNGEDSLSLIASHGFEEFSWNAVDKKKFKPTVVIQSDKINVELFDETFSSAPDPVFALYFFKNKQLTFHTEYQSSRIFKLEKIEFDSIRVFLKDSFGNVSACSHYNYDVVNFDDALSNLNNSIKYLPQDFPRKSLMIFESETKLKIPVSNHGELLTLETSEFFNWKMEFCSNENNNRMWLLSLDFVGRLLAYYEFSKDNRAIFFSRHYINSFIDFSNYQDNREYISEIPSRDHSTTFRVNALIKYLSIAGGMLPSNERASILSEIIYWVDWLYSPDYFHETNHGAMSSIALMVASCLFERHSYLHEKYFNKAIERLVLIASNSLCRDGLCYENTIGYHNFNLNLYKKSISFAERHELSGDGLTILSELVTNAELALRYAIRQDNTIPPIGDSPVYTVQYESINESKCFEQTGFAVIKDGNKYLSLQCGSRSEHHKQMDDSSITYRLSNEDIIIDAGSYSYDRQQGLGRYVESSCGHSGVFLKSFDNKRRKEVIYDNKGVIGKVKNLIEYEDISVVECSYYTGDKVFFADRKIFTTDEDDLLIFDLAAIVSGNCDDSIVVRYNIGPSFDVVQISRNHFGIKSRLSEYNIYIFGEVESELFHGYVDNAYFKGWHSVDFGVIKKNFTMELSFMSKRQDCCVVFTKKDLSTFVQSMKKFTEYFPATMNSLILESVTC